MIYEGHWKSGKSEGKGRLMFYSGTFYSGEFKNDLQDVYGVETLYNGETYDGQWSNGNKHGFGVLISLTVRTHLLPEYFGTVNGQITPHHLDAGKELLTTFLDFYKNNLLGPNWGEQVMNYNTICLSKYFLSYGLKILLG